MGSWEMQNTDFCKKPEEMRPFGKPRHRWIDITIDLRETEREGVQQIYMVQDRDQCESLDNPVANCCVPQNAKNFLTS